MSVKISGEIKAKPVHINIFPESLITVIKSISGSYISTLPYYIKFRMAKKDFIEKNALCIKFICSMIERKREGTCGMDHYEAINDILVNLFNEILDIEEKALISGEFRDISVNDMHVIEAIGIREPRNMSAVSRNLSVTVGTLTIAVNSLVKKGYVKRVRSEEDRRVVLISLTPKGEKAYEHHRKFHDKMVLSVLKDLNAAETEALTKALVKLQKFFRTYEKEE